MPGLPLKHHTEVRYRHVVAIDRVGMHVNLRLRLRCQMDDQLMAEEAIQSPANAGTLAATGKLTIDVNSSVGFDIYSTIRNGVTVAVQSLASLQTANGAISLYSVSLPTGKATNRGSFAAGNKVTDIAIPLNQL